MNGFDAPKIEYFTVSPILIVLGVAVIGVLIEAFAPRKLRYPLQVGTALVGLAAAFATSVVVFARLNPFAGDVKVGTVVAEGALAADGPAVFCWLLVLVLGALSVLGTRVHAERGSRFAVLLRGEGPAVPGVAELD